MNDLTHENIDNIGEIPDLDVCIDWVQVTIQKSTVDDVLLMLFGVTIDSANITKTESGRFGYNTTYTVYSKMQVMYNKKNEQMGVHILLIGSACREYEQLFSWQYFFEKILSTSYHFTRIDIAIDMYKKYFTVNQLRKKIKKGELATRFKQSTYIEQLNLKDGLSESSSLKFGSMSSDIYIVIYDKLRERINGGYLVSDAIKFWTRLEIRFKKTHSNQLVTLLMDHDFKMDSFLFKIIYNYLDFKESGYSDTIKSRIPTWEVWERFLHDTEKLRLLPNSYQTSIQKKKNYADRNLSKLMAMLCVVDNDFFLKLMKKGLNKINPNDLSIINSHLIATNQKVLTMSDINKLYEKVGFTHEFD